MRRRLLSLRPAMARHGTGSALPRARLGPRVLPALRPLLFALLFAGAVGGAEARDGGALFEALRKGEAFAIMRHALAPGISDPTGFDLDDCTTQRNLSEAGRRQAAEIGARFREGGIEAAEVFSSAWCRCRDTAKLLGLGPVRDLPQLNSFFEEPERREAQTAALKDWLAGHAAASPLVLVTHQVNIRALAGVPTSSGEVVVARLEPDATIRVLGTLPPR